MRPIKDSPHEYFQYRPVGKWTHEHRTNVGALCNRCGPKTPDRKWKCAECFTVRDTATAYTARTYRDAPTSFLPPNARRSLYMVVSGMVTAAKKANYPNLNSITGNPKSMETKRAMPRTWRNLKPKDGKFSLFGSANSLTANRFASN